MISCCKFIVSLYKCEKKHLLFDVYHKCYWTIWKVQLRVSTNKIKKYFSSVIIIKFACQLRYMLVAFVTPWIILYITVDSGFIKLFTYVIQSTSIKMLGFYCEIFVILKYCMKILLTWLLIIYTKRCYYCVPEGESCHRSFITYQACSCKEFRIHFSPAVSTYLIS